MNLFTPTHKPHWLSIPYNSIKEQDFDRWVILLNGDCSKDDVPPEVLQDTRAQIHESEHVGVVGALKYQACDILLRQGAKVLVELDHDDELTPGALDTLKGTAEEEFVFSDTASESKYSSEWGWEHQSEIINGKRYWVHNTPEVCSRSLFEIFFAPNHVRAWGRLAYKRTGGFSRDLSICDDHDLLCRTYIKGTAMRRIARPLYVQTVHRDQTQISLNSNIQRQQRKIGEKYLQDLAREEARRRGLRAIELGARPGDTEGFEALNKDQPADIVSDATKPLPFDTNSVGVFKAKDFLEHIPSNCVVPLMNEIYRCLAPGGWLIASTPSTDGRGAFQDPTHVSFWNSNSFWYYTKMDQARFVPEIACRFQLTYVDNSFPSDWHRMHNILYTDCALWALKGQRQIGAIEI